jgi:uncharacterized protein YuzE
MRMGYDSEVDALYVRLPEGDYHYQCRTVRLNDEVALNIGPGERLAGIEILDARQVFGGKESRWRTCRSRRVLVKASAAEYAPFDESAA